MPKRILKWSKALWLEAAKRLPYILLVFVVLWLVSAYTQFRKTTENIQATKNLTSRVVDLSQQNNDLSLQIKRLSAQNNALSRHNDVQQKCLFNLFVSFVNQAGVPTHADVDRCQAIASQALAAPSNTSSPPKVPQASAPTPQSRSAKPIKRSSSSSHSSHHSSPPSSSKQPGLVKRVLNFLGI